MTSLKIANTGNVDPAGDFYVEGVMPGDLYFQPARRGRRRRRRRRRAALAQSLRRTRAPRRKPGRQDLEDKNLENDRDLVDRSSPTPKFISGKGGGYLRPNGNLIAPRAEIFFLVNKEPVCRRPMTSTALSSPRSSMRRRWRKRRCARTGPSKRPPFYGTKWRITTQPKVVETANGPSEVHMYAFEPVGVIGESGGPTADQYRRGQALHETLKASDYPPFSSVAVISLRRFVNGSPGAGRNAPLPESEDDYGASAPANDDHDQIPF